VERKVKTVGNRVPGVVAIFLNPFPMSPLNDPPNGGFFERRRRN